jgi:hypothetical protein
VRVVQAAPLVYKLVVGTTADAVNQSIYRNPLYNFATYLDAGRSRRQSAEGFPAYNLRGFTAYAEGKRVTLQYVGGPDIDWPRHFRPRSRAECTQL